jgi:hypothetical protein
LVRHTTLVVAILATLGLAATPSNALGIPTSGSEAVSALMTGAVLMLLAAVARRAPVRKE